MKYSTVIVDKIYPIIENSLSKNTNQLKACIGRFVTNRYNELYDDAPYHRIYFGKNEIDDFFKSIKVNENEILGHLKNAFFWDMDYNPPQIKEPFVVAMICCIRYYLLKNNNKMVELTSIYLAFSGKFYASVHGQLFPKFPPSEHRPIMEYVINNKLTMKFELKREKNLFGAIRNLCITWFNTYATLIKSKSFDDHDVGAVIQQLRDREKSFLKNIAKLYYDAYENKDYMNYESDNLEDGSKFRIADNNSTKALQLTEQVLNFVTTNTIDYKFCKMCSDQNIKPDEIKFIMESILSNNDYIEEIKTVVNILIMDFMRKYENKSVGTLEFVSYSIKAKPNTKDKDIILLKNTITSWLDEKSPQYVKRKHRPATATSYYKAVLTYMVLIINKVAR